MSQTISQNILRLAKVTTGVAVVVATAIAINPSVAQAGPWDYAVGGTNNGTGGKVYDYQGIAIKEEGNDIFVALNTNMKLGKQTANTYNGELITYGDLFLNFSGKNFKEASDAGLLFGVHFATEGSQSGVKEVGLYKNVKAKNITTQNYGWNNTEDWRNAVKTPTVVTTPRIVRTPRTVRTPVIRNGRTVYVTSTVYDEKTVYDKKTVYVDNNSYGDLASNDDYFAGQQSGSNAILNAIDSGKKVGNIMMMDAQQLAAAGLNFGSASGAKGEKADGSVTLGFRFQKTADFKAGNFIANLFAECGNDGLAIKSVMERGRVPEPASMAGLAVVGGLGMLRRKRRRG